MEKLRTLCGKITGLYQKPLKLEESFPDFAHRFIDVPGTVVLLSGGNLDCARYHILATKPWLTFSGRHRDMVITTHKGRLSFEDDPFCVLRRILDTLHVPHAHFSAPLGAGLFGYLSYDLKDNLEVLPKTSVDTCRLPDIRLFAPTIMVIHDRSDDSTRLVIPLGNHTKGEILKSVLQEFEMTCAGPPKVDDAGDTTGRLVSNFTRSQYIDAVRRIKEYITAGHVYQVNISQRFQTPFSGNPFSLFKALFRQNPAPFFSFIHAGDHYIISTSPERFIFQDGNQVETRPIKGTRPRGRSPDEDQALKRTLERSKKDDAELSMIVDLVRNDLGKVCIPGSVRVSQHKRTEAYQNVYHLVSVVEGTLNRERTSVDLIAACLPGGSITGCPKIRAMEIIDELEPSRRHVYTGAIGYISFHDTMDLSIAIRTATLYDKKLFFSVGGGIVLDSDPADEYDETLQKGQTLMAAFKKDGIDGNSPRFGGFTWFNGTFMPTAEAGISVLDEGFLYGYGFFETIRANHGHPHLLEAHLARFNTTWERLFSDAPPDLSWAEIIRQVLIRNRLTHTTAAVKILATMGENAGPSCHHNMVVLARDYRHRLEDRPDSGFRLITYPHPRQTPLADYKTLNYLFYLLAGRWASERNADEALILNTDQSISETNTGNIIVIKNGQAVTPTSQHVLPGVMQTRVRELLSDYGYAISDAVLTGEKLLTAEAAFVTNSLIGAVPVVSIDNIPVRRAPHLENRLQRHVFAEPTN